MLNEDYKEMLQLLSEEQVDFIIVGAFALGAHGYPRATGDIDILMLVCFSPSQTKFKPSAGEF
jgi:hypothetical protein